MKFTTLCIPTALLAFAGFANADTLITYTVAVGPTGADLAGTSSSGITGFNPGGTTATYDFTASSAFPGSTAGITMNSLPSNAVLQSYDIHFSETITGSITATNNTTATFGTNAFVAVADEVALGLTAAPLFTTNDVFISDPNATKRLSLNGLAAGSSTSTTYSVTATGDSGAITTGLGDVKVDPLKLYIESLSSSSEANLANSGDFTYSNTLSGTAYITYDYIIPSTTPEPTTMVLFGSALVGLGLLRKRVRG